MFKKTNRITKRKDFETIFRKGKVFFSKNLTIKYKAGGNLARFAIVVSTKVSKLAVKRNRLRRILREVIKTSLNELMPGDYIVMAKPSILMTTPAIYREELLGLLTKMKAIKS